MKIIACGMLEAELRSLGALLDDVDVTFVERELHTAGPEKMRAKLQEIIDQTDAEAFDAIGLLYGLCSNGVVGLCSSKLPLVIPRAHDCITLLLGSRKKYSKEVEQTPGTYWSSIGWSLESENLRPEADSFFGSEQALDMDMLTEQYGEENAKFLFEQSTAWKKNYERLCFVEFGIKGEAEAIEKENAKAQKEGWRFETLDGNMSLLKKLIDRNWDKDFLVLNVGEKMKPSYNDAIIERASCQSE